MIQVQLSTGFSIIKDTDKTLYIDYRKGTLYHQVIGERECTPFDIRMEQGGGFDAAQIEIYGELTVVEEPSHGVNESVKSYKVMKAPRALFTKGVGKSSIKYFGVDFYPGFINYLVDRQHRDYRRILEISEYNKSFSAINPLLEQLDPTLLVQRFTGVLLGLEERERHKAITFTIESEKKLRESLASRCFKPGDNVVI